MPGGSAAQAAMLRAFFHILHFACVAGIDPLLENRSLREVLIVDRGDASQIETGFGRRLGRCLRHFFPGHHVIPLSSRLYAAMVRRDPNRACYAVSSKVAA